MHRQINEIFFVFRVKEKYAAAEFRVFTFWIWGFGFSIFSLSSWFNWKIHESYKIVGFEILQVRFIFSLTSSKKLARKNTYAGSNFWCGQDYDGGSHVTQMHAVWIKWCASFRWSSPLNYLMQNSDEITTRNKFSHFTCKVGHPNWCKPFTEWNTLMCDPLYAHFWIRLWNFWTD